MVRHYSARPGSTIIAAFFLSALAALPVLGSPEDRIGEKLKNAKLRDMNGKEARLLDFHKGKVLVIAYTGIGCPISERYMPRLASLQEQYAAKGVHFVAINANPQDSLKAIAREAKDRGIDFPILHDKNQDLTKQLDAKTSTEVFVIDSTKTVRYRGMIDDQYALGEKRDKPKVKYLQKALDAVLKGQEPQVTRTAAPGCLITRSEKKRKATSGKTKFTYASHVAKIMQNNCVSCHRPGQVGPFPLTDYEHVTGWAAMICRRGTPMRTLTATSSTNESSRRRIGKPCWHGWTAACRAAIPRRNRSPRSGPSSGVSASPTKSIR